MPRYIIIPLFLQILFLDTGVFAKEGLVEQMKQLECSVMKFENARFQMYSSYDVSGDRKHFDWKKIHTSKVPDGTRSKLIMGYEENFRFIRIKIGGSHLVSYQDDLKSEAGSNKAWNPDVHLLQIDNMWSIFSPDEGLPTELQWTMWNEEVNGVELLLIPINAVSVVSRAKERVCFGADKSNRHCWREFILKLPINSKLTAISDVESVTGYAVNNNKTEYDIDVWGLSGPSVPKNCK